MHLRNSQFTSAMGTHSNRLTQFKPNCVPKIKKFSSVWNRNTIGSANTRHKPNQSFTSSFKRSKSLDSRPKSVRSKLVHFTNGDESKPQEENEEQNLISRKPSAIYRFNSIQFLNSLRNFQHNTTYIHQTELSRHYRMSKDILDSFVRLKSTQIADLFGERQTKSLQNGNSEESNSKVTNDNILNEPNNATDTNNEQPSTKAINNQTKDDSLPKKTLQSTSMGFRKKTVLQRPKSASIYTRRNRLSSKNAAKMKTNDNGATATYSDEEHLNGKIRIDDEESENESLEPFFHRSLDKISSIANWERQIRYELEIEKELQRRELDRQKERILNDQRKLEEWDKQLRIELDARERKIRLNEEELRSRYEEFAQKSSELMRREQMINDIVTERIKGEMKFEIEKLRKKFNELELDKSNLTKKEERVKEVETRLHEQVSDLIAIQALIICIIGKNCQRKD